MKKIIVIIPYFGRWPFWMDLFLASCRANPTIDWLLLGDCGRPENSPTNLKFVEISFSDYKKKVAKSLDISFDPQSAYKLCDIKPMLGKIHEQEISDYDFWAFGDLDLVYGDLRAVYTEDLLSKYDVISNHATRVSGHLCLLRNTEEMRTIFRKAPGWKQKIESQQHLAFDEKAFSKIFVKHKNFPAWLRKPLIWLVYPLSRRVRFTERYTTPNGCIAWRDGRFNFPAEWYWDAKEGISNSFQKEPDMPYYHFAVWKKSDWSDLPVEQCIQYREGTTYRFSVQGIDRVETVDE